MTVSVRFFVLQYNASRGQPLPRAARRVERLLVDDVGGNGGCGRWMLRLRMQRIE